MKERINKICCYLGWHSWHTYDRFDQDGRHERQLRICNHCRHREALGKIEIEEWE